MPPITNSYRCFHDLLQRCSAVVPGSESAVGTQVERLEGRILEVGLERHVPGLPPQCETDASRQELEPGLELPVRGWDPLGLVALPTGPAGSSPAANVASQVEPLLTEALRSIAWGGDRRRGVARLQLGGRYDGASIRVDASDGRLSVELDAPPGVDAHELAERLGERLRARGLELDSLTVR